jgi:hypothetical protein
MITVELTENHIEILTEGALRYGRIAIGVKSREGDDDVIIVYAQTHRRGRPARGARPQPQSPANPHPQAQVNGPAGEPQ